MKFVKKSFIALVATVLSVSAFAEQPNSVPPDQLGFAVDRLERVTSAFQGYVDSGQIPGAVVLIARKDQVAYFRAFGYRDREQKIAMTTDSIFRIASMTKPIASIGAMILAEEGKLDIGAPVSNYLPELRTCRLVSNRSILLTARKKLSCSLRCGR
jgi:CubicO group peptidase (beta-lactamase class C family)